MSFDHCWLLSVQQLCMQYKNVLRIKRNNNSKHTQPFNITSYDNHNGIIFCHLFMWPIHNGVDHRFIFLVLMTFKVVRYTPVHWPFCLSILYYSPVGINYYVTFFHKIVNGNWGSSQKFTLSNQGPANMTYSLHVLRIKNYNGI